MLRTASETFATQVDGRIYYVRTGDQLPEEHQIVQKHPWRFDHQVDLAPPVAAPPADPPAADLASQ
jgi:hypothetical protein